MEPKSNYKFVRIQKGGKGMINSINNLSNSIVGKNVNSIPGFELIMSGQFAYENSKKSGTVKASSAHSMSDNMILSEA